MPTSLEQLDQFDIEFEQECVAERAQFTVDFLGGINHLGVSGSGCGFFIYAKSEDHARSIENELNARGLTNTKIHESFEPECGAFVCQANTRSTYSFTGHEKYQKIVETIQLLCKSLKIIPKYVYVDNSRWSLELKDKEAAENLVKEFKKRFALTTNVTLECTYLTTFKISITF